MGEPEHRFARPSIQRARFVAAGVVATAVAVAALAFMVAGVDDVEVVATLLFAPVVIAAIVGGRKLGYAVALVATGVYLALRFGDMDDTGTTRVLVLVAARAACFGVVAYATPLLADRVPSLAQPVVSSRHGKQAAQEWEQAALPAGDYELEDSFAFSEPVPAGPPPGPPQAWEDPQPAAVPGGWDEQPPYDGPPYDAPLYDDDRYAQPVDHTALPTAWDTPPAVEPQDPWAPPPEPAAPLPPPAPPGEWAPPLAPVAAAAPGEWAPEPEPEPMPSAWESQPYLTSAAAAPSVPTGWIDDATVPLGDETIPVGFTGELFLPRELREHPLVEQPLTNGNGSSNGGARRHLADVGDPPPPPPPPLPSSQPQPPSRFAGEASLSPPGPGPRRPDTGSQRRIDDTGEHHSGVDPETRLWNAHFFRDRLTQARDDSRRSGAPFSLVMVQVADEPFQALPYRRQVALLRELGHQFVQARVLDHLVHLPDGAQHWFAVILPDTDSAGAHLVERRLRSAIGGYLRSRGLRIQEVQSASLTSPDDDEALASVWASLLGSTSV